MSAFSFLLGGVFLLGSVCGIGLSACAADAASPITTSPILTSPILTSPATSLIPVPPVATAPQKRSRTSGEDLPVKARPVMVGQKVPTLTLKNIDGENIELPTLLSGRMTLLAFTNQAMTTDAGTQNYFAALRPYITSLGYQTVIVTPVAPAVIHATQNSFAHRILLADENRDAFMKMGLADTHEQKDPVTVGIFLVGPDQKVFYEFASSGNSVAISGEVLVLAAKVYRDLAFTLDKKHK